MSENWLNRFTAKINFSENCWLWKGALDDQGYGRFMWEGKNRKAYRVAYEHQHGPVPKGFDLDHLCRIRKCINPNHLEIVTHKENILRGTGPSAQHARKQISKCGKPYDIIRLDGARACSNCKRMSDSKRDYKAERRRRKEALLR